MGEARRIILYQADYILMKNNCKDCKVYLKKTHNLGVVKKKEYKHVTGRIHINTTFFLRWYYYE